MEKFTKLLTQWSTYRGAFLTTGAAFLVQEQAETAVSLVDQVFNLGVLAIGMFDTFRDSSKES